MRPALITSGKFMVLAVEERFDRESQGTYIDVHCNGRTYDTLAEAESVVGDMHPRLNPVIVVVVKGNV